MQHLLCVLQIDIKCEQTSNLIPGIPQQYTHHIHQQEDLGILFVPTPHEFVFQQLYGVNGLAKSASSA